MLRRGFLALTILTLTVVLASLCLTSTAQAKVYFTTWSTFGEGRVYSAELDGSNTQLLFTDSTSRYTTGLQVDTTNGLIYFAESSTSGGQGGSDARIWKMNLDGSSPTVLATTGQNAVWNLSLNPLTSVLYFNSQGANPQLGRVNTNGSGLSYFANPNGGEGVDVDIVNNQLFYQRFNDFTIQKISTSGGSPTQVLADGVYHPGIETDPANSRVFLATYNGDTIKRVNYDGTGLTTVATLPNSPGVSSLDYKPALGKIYYSGFNGNFGYVDLLNGNAVTQLFDNNMQAYAAQFVVVPEPAGAAILALLAPIVLRRTRRI